MVTRGGTKTSPHSGYAQVRPTIIGATRTHRISSPVSLGIKPLVPPRLDRNELGALLVTAGLGPPAEHALFSLLALNGLRVSEAIGAEIEHLGMERGHRTLAIMQKGGKVVTIPLAPRTARRSTRRSASAAKNRCWSLRNGRRPDRPAGCSPRRDAKHVSTHPLRHAPIPTRSTPGCRCGTYRRPHTARIRGPPALRQSGPAAVPDRHATPIVAAYLASAAR